MPTITNTITGLDGSAPQGYQRDVKITLVYDEVTQAIPVVNDDTSLLGTLALRTDSAGTWTAELYDNSDITPAGSAYKITEGSGDSARTYHIEVAAVDAEVKDILVAEPDYTP